MYSAFPHNLTVIQEERVTKQSLNSTIMLIVICLCLTVPTFVCAQGLFGVQAVGARASAMGFTGFACGSKEALWFNPAGLASVKDPAIVATGHDLYALGLVSQYSASLVYPMGRLAAGSIGWHHTGTSSNIDFLSWSEDDFVFSFAGHIIGQFSDDEFSGVDGGISVHYLQPEMGVVGSGVAIDAGIIASLRDVIRLGLSVRNIGKSQIHFTSGERETIPFHLGIGLQLKPVRPITLALDFDRLEARTEKHFGLEAQIIPKILALRAGLENLNGNSWNWSTGLGLGVKKFQIDYALRWHVQLQQTHQFTLSCMF